MRKDRFILSSLRGDNRGQAIFKLGNNVNRKITGIFLLCRKIGMTILLIIVGSLDDCCCNRGITIKKYALQKIGITIPDNSF